MINTELKISESPRVIEERVESIVSSGPVGALTVAGIATAIVVLMWLLFYLLVFLPRGGLQ
ncbi:hypothetical protein ASE23_25485 [Rhizobium sp. Root73]|uniref:hypothetical protein n=1 Tax=unclassified Rhizobium TaxID=2613769 RepID=UPI0007291FC7|nr:MULTISPECIES: hypothetical protein [unclassified Rhizobium]KQY15690.1 hypothetical protein ASD36_24955 [Rhizobium sp. Root1334]KRC08778.1 hypothetical protein ASE23_25485 [Rhizobium sp. Root73]